MWVSGVCVCGVIFIQVGRANSVGCRSRQRGRSCLGSAPRQRRGALAQRIVPCHGLTHGHGTVVYDRWLRGAVLRRGAAVRGAPRAQHARAAGQVLSDFALPAEGRRQRRVVDRGHRSSRGRRAEIPQRLRDRGRRANDLLRESVALLSRHDRSAARGTGSGGDGDGVGATGHDAGGRGGA